MTSLSRPLYWTRWRLLGIAAAVGVVAVFIAANVHLVAVSLVSQPDCVLPSDPEGAAPYRAAKPSC